MFNDVNATLVLARKIAFGVATVLGFICLALGASITHWTSSNFLGGYFSFAALAIAVGILTIFSLPALYWVSLTRKSAIASMIAVELGWTWFLWIMWLALAGSAASVNWLGSCNVIGENSFESVCHQSKAVTAFGFLGWLILMAYNFFLFFLTVRQHTRGNTRVWNGYILETDFQAPHVNKAEASAAYPVPQATNYPPAATAQV